MQLFTEGLLAAVLLRLRRRWRRSRRVFLNSPERRIFQGIVRLHRLSLDFDFLFGQRINVRFEGFVSRQRDLDAVSPGSDLERAAHALELAYVSHKASVEEHGRTRGTTLIFTIDQAAGNAPLALSPWPPESQVSARGKW